MTERKTVIFPPLSNGNSSKPDTTAVASLTVILNKDIADAADGFVRHFFHFQSPVYEVGVKPYIAAEGHFGNKSKTLVKEIAISLGFDYFSANDKSSFNLIKKQFVSDKLGTKPIIFEVFTEADAQSEAWKIISNLIDGSLKEKVIYTLKDLKNSNIANFIKQKINYNKNL